MQAYSTIIFAVSQVSIKYLFNGKSHCCRTGLHM